MKQYKNKNSGGFTLIEMIIYLALFTMLITGSISAGYSIFESSGRSESKALLQEEGDFLMAKIAWSLSGIQSLNTPLANTTGPTLSVTKWDPLISNPVVFSVSVSNDLQIARGSNPAKNLNSSNVWITGLSFTDTTSTGSGINPESVKTIFTLNTRTPNGQILSETFSGVNYLRK